MLTEKISQNKDTGRWQVRGGEVHVRWAMTRDLPEVLAIESAWPHSWDEEEYRLTLAERNVIGMIAEECVRGEPVIAHMVYLLEKNHLEVVKFSVHPSCVRRGVGSAMIAKLYSKLSSHRRTRIAINVRETNLEGLLFLKANGFEAIRVDRGAFDGEDSYRMIRRLPEGEA